MDETNDKSQRETSSSSNSGTTGSTVTRLRKMDEKSSRRNPALMGIWADDEQDYDQGNSTQREREKERSNEKDVSGIYVLSWLLDK